MAVSLPDILGYLNSQGFGPREMATLEVADSDAIARQVSFEMNTPHSKELVDAVEQAISIARSAAGMMQRTEGVLASDLAWVRLAPMSDFPDRPWLDQGIPPPAADKRPPPGERAKKLLANGEEIAARELNWSRSCPLLGRRWSRCWRPAWTPIKPTSCYRGRREPPL